MPASSFPSARRSVSAAVRLALLSLPAALLLAACSGKNDAPAGTAPQPPPAPEVGVVTVAPTVVPVQTELPGRVEPVRVAQVRARVSGVVLKRTFREGSEVKAGQLLFQIDAAPYRAQVASAQAALAKAQANLSYASTQAERYKPLVEANAVSRQEYLNVVAAQKQAEADVAGATAAVQTARINLGYADVTAPISGRIGRALVTEGALANQAEATQLALIQQIRTVYVNFTQSANDVLKLRRAFEANQLRRTGDGAAAVHVVLEDGSEFGQVGKLLFTDLSVDATSGQVTLRAEVPNPQSLLLPGQYVRVRLVQAELPSAVLLPQQAVTRSTQGDSVLVVGPDNKPTPRPIKVGSNQNNQWIVLEGLKAGEQVIVEGFQKMMVPGAPVKPVPWRGGAPSAASAAGGGSAAAAAGASGAASDRAAMAAAAPAASAVSAR